MSLQKCLSKNVPLKMALQKYPTKNVLYVLPVAEHWERTKRNFFTHISRVIKIQANGRIELLLRGFNFVIDFVKN